MNLRRLKYFIQIVDQGSLTKAADALHIAQPALSQQLAILESEMDQQLVIRSPRHFTVTDAGQTLYRHAQAILRQCEDAKRDVHRGASGLSGKVTLGLAPGRIAAQLALPVFAATRARLPGVVLSLVEGFGSKLGEQVLSGRADMAVLYDNERGTHGLNLYRIAREPLVLLALPSRVGMDAPTISLAGLSQLELILPRQSGAERQIIDDSFVKLGLQPRIVGEIESPTTIHQVLSAGLASAILPESLARMLAATNPDLSLRTIVEPSLTLAVSICTSTYLPMSEQAKAVLNLLLDRTPDLFKCSDAQESSNEPVIAQRIAKARAAA